MEIVESSKKIDKWMDDRGTELLDAINHNNMPEIKDAIGDIYVTIRGVCRVLDLSMDECVFMAYNQIKDRTGHLTSEGVFVKDE